MLKDAALATLEIQIKALEYDMSLKDANCYNIQFINGKPCLIDTSSFEIYKENLPWNAYRQFCENFLAPLALASFKDARLMNMMIFSINGLSLDLASKLLKSNIKSFFNLGILMHLHLHSMMQKKYSEEQKVPKQFSLPKKQQIALLHSLVSTVKSLKLPKMSTQWQDYYSITNYSDESFKEKYSIIQSFQEKLNPSLTVDFGTNTGLFSRIFANENANVIALDIDFMAVEKNYLNVRKQNEKNILPLKFDLVNPSSAVGFANQERLDLFSRLENVDLILALALIHHLVFTYNIPFFKIAELFSKLSRFLIIEFVDKQDSKVQKMLLNREDIFYDYRIEKFESVFSQHYKIIEKKKITNTKRTLYLMESLYCA